MAFQDVRQNSTVYIINKQDRPVLEIGKVASEPLSRLKQSELAQPNIFKNPFEQVQQQLKVVDISVQINGDTLNIEGLPAAFDFSDMKDYVISTNRNLINDYAKSQKDEADNILANQERYQSLSAGYGEIVKQLNPEIAAQEKRDEEIKNLKDEIALTRESNKRIEIMLSKLLQKGEVVDISVNDESKTE